MWRLLLVLGLFTSFALVWSQPSISGAAEKVTQGSAIAAPREDNSRCALGSHWRRTTSKPRDYDSDQMVEWISSAGPTSQFVAPQFRCVSARLFRDPFGDSPGRVIDNYEYDSDVLWCGPGVSVLLIWEVFGGEAPYTISAAGHRSVPSATEMRIPCADIKRIHSGESSSESQELSIPIRLEDSRSVASTILMPVNLLAPVPSGTVDDFRFVPGWFDANVFAVRIFEANGSQWESAGVLRYEATGPFVPVAVGRYRTHGSVDWSYFSLSIRPPQSERLYFPANLSPLKPMTNYEVQGGWIWATEHYQFQYDIDGDSDWPYWFETWREWATPEEVNWSESHQFRSGGPICIEPEVTGNVIAIWKLSDRGRPDCASNQPIILTWLTSPAWPGVFWARAFHTPGRRLRTARPTTPGLIDYYIGLPEQTDFVLTWQEPLPLQLRQAPQHSLNVRTQVIPPYVHLPGVDPGDIKIRVGADQIIVEWSDQEPYLLGTARLASEDSWDYEATKYRRQGGDSRVVTEFKGLGGEDRFTLSVRFIASETLGDGSSYPNMCLIREIRMPPGGADAYLDHYFTGLPEEQGPEIRPVETSSVSVSWFYYYHYAACELAVYAYP